MPNRLILLSSLIRKKFFLVSLLIDCKSLSKLPYVIRPFFTSRNLLPHFRYDDIDP